ncbi:MAG: NCS2 family permease [Aliidongia sp.]
MGLTERLDRSKVMQHFQLHKYGTKFTTETFAGMSTFLSLAYIFIVNPAILAQSGIDPKAALFATVISASLATLAMGFWANLPFAVAPGLTMNSYFTYVVSKKMHMTWQEGLCAVFVSGIVCVTLTALPVRQRIIDSIPFGLKRSIAVTVGVFVATIGLFLSKIISFTSYGFIDISALNVDILTAPLVMVFFTGLIVSIILGLKRLNFPAGMLIAIIISAITYHIFLPIANSPVDSSGDFASSLFKLDFSAFFHSRFWLPVLVFTILDFFEGIGEFIGMTSNTTIQDKNGNVTNIGRGLWVDGLGTIGGSLLGTSSLIIFVESAVGIKVGGRTGLTAVVCSFLMMITAIASYYFSSILYLIPAQATAGILVYVGYLLISNSVLLKPGERLSRLDFIIALTMCAISFLTFSLDKSLAFGLWAYFLLSLIPQNNQRPAYWLAGTAAALTAAIVWQG